MKCTLIDNNTGEILSDNFQLDTIEDLQRKKNAIEKKKLTEQFKLLQSEFLGNFIFFIFKNIDYLKQILNDNDLVKFIYIGTYIKDNGALMLDNNKTYINKKQLKTLLNTNDETFRVFYNKIIKHKLLLEHEDILYINLEYFWRGKESKYKSITNVTMKDFTRLYINTTRELYLNTNAKSYKKLAIIYKLIPFINWKYNILCYNIVETSKDKIKALTISDVIDLIGYNKNQLARFKKDFYSLKYNDYQIFRTVQYDPEYTNSFIIVNPLLFYRGNDLGELQHLINLFNIKPIHNKL